MSRNHLVGTALILTCLMLFLVPPLTSYAAGCPSDTVYIGEDDDYLYCKRVGDYVGNDQATRAAIIRNAMAKARYPYHMVEGRCLSGDVSMCPTTSHSGGCYDCSALVFDVLRSIGVWVEPSADNQYNYFKSIPGGLKGSDPIYGDVVFIQSEDGSRIVHTGIFVGTRADRIYYVNASSTKKEVRVSRMPIGVRPRAYGDVSRLRVGKVD